MANIEIDPLMFEMSKNVEILTHDVDRLNHRIDRLEKKIDLHHDKFMFMEGSQKAKNSFVIWASRYGMSVIGVLMALGAIMYELKKMKP